MKHMEAKLSVISCDKCGEPMKKGQPVVIVAGGDITDANCKLIFESSGIRYACHSKCWDGIEEDD
jgi:hypothetical protein